jgi:protein involved in plasmid replication-relaxation
MLTRGTKLPGQERLPKYRRKPTGDKKGPGYGPLTLTENDARILGYDHDYRYVRSEHLCALMPGNDRHLARRLQGLYHHAFLDRLVPMVHMRQAEDDAGSPKMVYILDQAGAEELARRRRTTVRDLPWRKPQGRRLEWFVEHHTGISDLHAALEIAVANRPDLQLAEWRQDAELRDFAKYGGQVYRVNPDAYFAVADGVQRDEQGLAREGTGTRRNLFVEVDRGTEEAARLYRRFEDYAWYLRSRQYENRYAGKHPEDVRVLFVAPDDKRVREMLRELQSALTAIRDYEKERALHRDPYWRSAQLRWFWFTTADRYDLKNPARILEPIWRAGKNAEERFALFK